MPVLVRCNKADDPRCPGCVHQFEHEPNDCTTWEGCYGRDGHLIEGLRVRCVKVKEEDKP
jgi:hypothetical protein